MRIIYYSPHPALNLTSPSGYGTHMREMITAFKNAGHEVELFIAGGTEPYNNGSQPANSSGFRRLVKDLVPAKIWETLKDLQLIRYDKRLETQLATLVDRFKPDLIYERSNYLQISGVKIARQKNILHFLEVNAPYVEERVTLGGRSLLLKKGLQAERYQLCNSSHIIVVSSILKEYFSNKHNLPTEKFLVTPNAIDQQKIMISAGKHFIPLGEQWKNNIVFGFVGSVFPWHGVDILVESFAKIEKENGLVRLLIIGDGETMPVIKQRVLDLKLADKVVFTGNLPHAIIYDYIRMMDVTVMAKSNWYGSPVKIFEYGAAKKPVIAPDTEPLRDVMEHMRTGYLIQSNIDSLYNAMKWMIENKEAAIEMAERFHLQVVEQHQWKHNSERVISVYQKKIEV